MNYFIDIFTDGSSHIDRADRKCSSAYITHLSSVGVTKQLTSGGKYFEVGTNSKGEVSAILLALNDIRDRLENTKNHVIFPPYNINIIGDSMFAIEGCRSWIYGWIKNARNGVMYNSKGEIVSQSEIFQDIHDNFLTNKKYIIKFTHVNSHILDNSIYEKEWDNLGDMLDNSGKRKLISEKLLTHKDFVKSFKAFYKHNNYDIDAVDYLWMLYHNKECDKLASTILQNGLKG